MKRKWTWILAGIGILALLGGGTWQATHVTVTFIEDGQERPLTASGVLTVGALLAQEGIALAPEDRLIPAQETWLQGGMTITLDRPSQVLLVDGGQKIELLSHEPQRDALLKEAGLTLKPGDRLLWNGKELEPQDALPADRPLVLQVQRAVDWLVQEDGTVTPQRTLGASLAAGLVAAGVTLSWTDQVSPALDSPLTASLTVKITRAQPLQAVVDGQTLSGTAAVQTVGEALAALGIALQGLDYSVPAENEPLPASGEIQVVRVREETILEQRSIPFEIDFQADPETELDQSSVVDEGAEGLLVTRVRVRYENGQEVSRVSDAEWQARAPRNRILGYGTKIVIRKEEVDGQVIEYWRKLTMYATSFSPCRLGTGKCNTTTASGAPLQKGIVGVKCAWFPTLRGQGVYVTGYGYGVYGDCGGAVPGKLHIDLGYTDEDYVGWHSYTTVYFLTPVPANIIWVMQ